MSSFKPRDRVDVTIANLEVDADGDVCVGGDYYRANQLAPNANVTITPHAEPYRQARKGDVIEMPARLVVRENTINGRLYARSVPGGVGRAEVGPDELAKAMDAGQVRLVEAAAPEYQAGGIYFSPKAQALFLRINNKHQPWLRLSGDPQLLLPDEVPEDDLLLTAATPAKDA